MSPEDKDKSTQPDFMEGLFRDQFKDWETPPPAGAWEQIKAKTEMDRKAAWLPWRRLSPAVLMGLVGVLGMLAIGLTYVNVIVTGPGTEQLAINQNNADAPATGSDQNIVSESPSQEGANTSGTSSQGQSTTARPTQELSAPSTTSVTEASNTQATKPSAASTAPAGATTDPSAVPAATTKGKLPNAATTTGTIASATNTNKPGTTTGDEVTATSESDYVTNAAPARKQAANKPSRKNGLMPSGLALNQAGVVALRSTAKTAYKPTAVASTRKAKGLKNQEPANTTIGPAVGETGDNSGNLAAANPPSESAIAPSATEAPKAEVPGDDYVKPAKKITQVDSTKLVEKPLVKDNPKLIAETRGRAEDLEPYWSVQGYFMPRYTFRRVEASAAHDMHVRQLESKSLHATRLGWETGLRLAHRFANAWEVNVGTHFANLNEELSFQYDMDRPGSTTYDVLPDGSLLFLPKYHQGIATQRSQFYYLGLQTGASYYLLNNRFRLSSGMGLNWLTRGSTTRTENGQVVDQFSFPDQDAPFEQLNMHIYGGAAYVQPINTRLKFVVEPTFNLFLFSTYSSREPLSVTPSTMGLNILLQYKL